MTATVFDARACELGEGPLWHPGRSQLFWFDILGQRLLTRTESGPGAWEMPEITSAAGWVDTDTLLLASETGICTLDLVTGARSSVATLEAERPETRSNDGRADPYGGFWIGTMGKSAETGLGAIHRLYRGEVRALITGITIPNAICFSPDGLWAYFTDTPSQIIQRLPLAEGDGWPSGDPEPWIDLRQDGVYPDGAVIDAQGHIWNAQWGAARVARYDDTGAFVSAVAVPAGQSSCPAFGGPDLSTLFVTSAGEGMSATARAADPHWGQTFAVPDAGRGVPEPKVIL